MNDSEQAKAEDRSSRLRRKLIVVAVVWAIALAAGLLGYVAWKGRQERKAVADQQAQLRQSGWALSAPELAQRWPNPPPQENLLLILGGALSNVVPSSSFAQLFEGPLLKRKEPLPADLLEALKVDVMVNRRPLETVPRPFPSKARFPLGFELGFTNFLSQGPSMLKLRTLNEAQCLAAVWHGEQGEGDEALGLLATQLAISRAYKRGTLVGCMVGGALENRTCWFLERVINRAVCSEEALELVAGELSARNRVEFGSVAMVECAVGNWAWETLRDDRPEAIRRLTSASIGGGPLADLQNWWERVRHLRYSPEQHLLYLRCHAELVSMLEQPPHVALESVRQWQAELSAAAGGNHVLQWLLPNWGRATEAVTQNTAEKLSAQTAVAVERYRLAHGQLPPALSSLVPSYLPGVPLDPCDGKPLRYRILPEGYAVYSVGLDGVDGEGKEGGTADSDLVFTVER